MSGSIVIVVVLMVVVGMIFLRLRRQSILRLAVDASRARMASIAVIRVRIRNLIALGATAVVIVVLYRIGLAAASDLGRIVLLIPLLAASAAITFFAIVPVIAIPEKSTKRTALLDRRRPSSFGARWMFVVPTALAAVLVGVVVALGTVADSDGRSFSFSTVELSNTASPFPGYFYGLPVIAATALLAGLAVASLSRIAAAGRPSDESLREADTTLRRLAVQVILKSAIAALSVTLGVMLLLAGSATGDVGRGLGASVGDSSNSAAQASSLFVIVGTVELATGGLLLLAGLAFLAWAVADAVRNPFVAALLPKATV